MNVNEICQHPKTQNTLTSKNDRRTLIGMDIPSHQRSIYLTTIALFTALPLHLPNIAFVFCLPAQQQKRRS
jgi:hypothetical protein